MSGDQPDPWALDGPVFAAAQMRATARDGLLSGIYLLVDGELRRETSRTWSRGGQDYAVDPAYPGARLNYFNEWVASIPYDQVVLEVQIKTFAKHIKGATLQLRYPKEPGVYAVLWPHDPNNHPPARMPDGFIWEKNDDYYYGTVRWEDLSDVDVRVRRYPLR